MVVQSLVLSQGAQTELMAGAQNRFTVGRAGHLCQMYGEKRMRPVPTERPVSRLQGSVGGELGNKCARAKLGERRGLCQGNSRGF